MACGYLPQECTNGNSGSFIQPINTFEIPLKLNLSSYLVSKYLRMISMANSYSVYLYVFVESEVVDASIPDLQHAINSPTHPSNTPLSVSGSGCGRSHVNSHSVSPKSVSTCEPQFMNI